jgi:catechol 2,3-dioxygenase-like lactoylglutathione lyase family enzyme
MPMLLVLSKQKGFFYLWRITIIQFVKQSKFKKMIKNLVVFVLMISVCAVSAQKVPAPEEFSNPTIQVGLVVSDLDKAVDFYTKIIGMTRTGSFSVSGEKAKNLGLTDGRRIDVTVLKLEDSVNSNEWKMMSFGEKAAHPKQKYLHDDTGLQYITIFVKNIHPFIERIQKNNIQILSGTPSTLEDGRGFILVQDPDGTFIELIGPQ